MKYLLLFCLTLGLVPGAAAQQLPPDLLADEDFQHPLAGHYWLGKNSEVQAELTSAGYLLRFVGAAGLNNQPVNPPGPGINQSRDFVIEGELRGQGGDVGLYWGGGRNASGNNFTVVQLTLSAANPTVDVLRLQSGSWAKLGSRPLPQPGAADWHTIRIARSGPVVSYWLDGTRLLEQPWVAPEGRNVGLTVQQTGAAVTLRRLRIWHHSGLRLAPNVPADLRRERLSTPGLNTERNENSPMVSADGRFLYFARVMGDPNAIDSPTGYDSDTFVAERGADGQWGQVQALGPPVNTPEASNYPLYVAPDGQTLLMSGRYSPEGKLIGAGLSRTQRQADGRWSMPQPLPAGTGTRSDFGVRNYTSCLDASGTALLVSAVLKTNLSNTDLYLCRLQPDGSWSSPQLLPAPLNTEGNETAPFLAPDGKTLYFTSDTHPGYGGNDIFVSTRLDDTWMKWSEPLNLGPAVNSVRDEMYYTAGAAGDYAYLAVDNGSGNSDIYRLVLPPTLRPAPTLLVRGRVLDAVTNQAIHTAEVRYEQLPTGSEAGVVLPAAAGSFEAVLPGGQLYGLRASANGYLSVNENLDLTDLKKYGEVTQDLLLMPILPPTEALTATTPKLNTGPAAALPATVQGVAAPAPVAEAPIALHNVFFVQSKPVLLPGSFPELARLAQTLQEHPSLRLRLDGHTDNGGDPKANLVLSQQRVAALKAYLVKQGVAESRLETQGWGDTRPVAPNDSEANKRKNRRVEFVILSR